MQTCCEYHKNGGSFHKGCGGDLPNNLDYVTFAADQNALTLEEKRLVDAYMLGALSVLVPSIDWRDITDRAIAYTLARRAVQP